MGSQDDCKVCDRTANALLQSIQGKNSTLVVELKVNIVAAAYLLFPLSAHDSIDKDYVSIGSLSANTEIEAEIEVSLTFEGGFGEGEEYVNVVGLKFLSSPRVVNFGYIEPDCWYEE